MGIKPAVLVLEKSDVPEDILVGLETVSKVDIIKAEDANEEDK